MRFTWNQLRVNGRDRPESKSGCSLLSHLETELAAALSLPIYSPQGARPYDSFWEGGYIINRCRMKETTTWVRNSSAAMADARRPNLKDEAHNNARATLCISRIQSLCFNPQVWHRSAFGEAAGAEEGERKRKCEKWWKFRGEPDGSGSWSEQEKKPLSATIHPARLVQGILMGFLRGCSTLYLISPMGALPRHGSARLC